MSDAVAATGTPAPAATATPVAETTSALATAAKSAGVESMLSAAAKAAAAEPSAHDYGKLKADGVHADVLKVLGESFGENKIAPEAAQKLLDKVLPAMQARREAEIKEQIAAADKQWQEELRADKEFGGDKWEANAKVVDAAVKALDPEGYEQLKASGLIGHPSLNRIVLRAEAILAKATKQDQAMTSGALTPDRRDPSDTSAEAFAEVYRQ